MNDNYEMPEINRLWIELVSNQQSIAEQVHKSAQIMQKLGNILFGSADNERH